MAEEFPEFEYITNAVTDRNYYEHVVDMFFFWAMDKAQLLSLKVHKEGYILNNSEEEFMERFHKHKIGDLMFSHMFHYLEDTIVPSTEYDSGGGKTKPRMANEASLAMFKYLCKEILHETPEYVLEKLDRLVWGYAPRGIFKIDRPEEIAQDELINYFRNLLHRLPDKSIYSSKKGEIWLLYMIENSYFIFNRDTNKSYFIVPNYEFDSFDSLDTLDPNFVVFDNTIITLPDEDMTLLDSSSCKIDASKITYLKDYEILGLTGSPNSYSDVLRVSHNGKKVFFADFISPHFDNYNKNNLKIIKNEIGVPIAVIAINKDFNRAEIILSSKIIDRTKAGELLPLDIRQDGENFVLKSNHSTNGISEYQISTRDKLRLEENYLSKKNLKIKSFQPKRVIDEEKLLITYVLELVLEDGSIINFNAIPIS